ncbi:hypothetical protein F4780DRAFT_560873 [Xylariomycetidae sp. FL0641]|nr:hypothetical protein F4780DRAFT_560873 [Xylariomycetidae sp. FL0641]
MSCSRGSVLANASRQLLRRPRLSVPYSPSTTLSYSSRARETDDGRNVIITGSSRGIGKAIALRLARDGHNLCINDIGANRAGCDAVVAEIRALGRKACVAVADVTKTDEVDAMIATCVEELGPLDTMIANAGIAQVKPLLEVSERDFRRMFEVNVFGVQNSLAAAARQMIAQGRCAPARPGKLLAAASIVAFKPFALLPHYSASKWAVRGLTQAYAMDLAPHHITANAYAPGIVGTAMWDLIDAGVAAQKGLQRGETMRRMVHDLTALGRPSVPEDVAKAVSFLVGPDSNFMTGQTQVVDGGIIYT